MSLQPFFIGGPFKTGLYDYLEKWLSPTDGFSPLENAYIYKGTLNKRMGYIELGSGVSGVITDPGSITYRGLEYAAAGANPRTGTLTNIPMRSLDFNATDGTETFTDPLNDGTLVGDAGGSGTINYTTGDYSLTFNIAAARQIVIGYTYVPSTTTSIMGIFEHVDAVSNFRSLIVCDQKRASKWNDTRGSFDPIYEASVTMDSLSAASQAYTINTGFTNLAHFSVTVTIGGEPSTDDGAGVIAATATYIAASTVNYGTGVITVNTQAFGAAGQRLSYRVDVIGDYFSGDTTKFFNWIRWGDILYMTNNNDRVTIYDGTYIGREPYSITTGNYATYTNDITTCLGVKVYKNSLMFLRPIENSVIYPSRIDFSAINTPQNFAQNISGNGGFQDAPTGDWLMGGEFLKDILVCKFERSDYNFRYTGNAFDPFRFDLVSTSRSTAAPYAIIAYDTYITAAGKKGLTATDGILVRRYDEAIPNFYNEDIDAENYNLCFSKRFDDLQQTWMLYPDRGTSSGKSDKVLVYNFQERTWASYDMSFSCLGTAETSRDKLWEDMDDDWEEGDYDWDASFFQAKNIQLLAGGHDDGKVYELNSSVMDNGESFNFNITSSEWNPFVKTGQKIQMAYIDLFYNSNIDSEITIKFYVNSSETAAITRTVILNSPDSKRYGFKRVFANLIGQFVRMEIYLSGTQLANPDIANHQLVFNAFVLHARPAGRITR